jgi:hypothetical protein
MQLLDSTLAFVLTLAALATVVTVIMEACLRTARMRKKNLVEVMKLLNKELGSSTLGMDEDERWKFFIRVVQNPAEAAIETLNPELGKLDLAQKIAYLGREKGTGKEKITRALLFIRQLFGDKKRSGLYTDVSLEYMLRCLAQSKPVKEASLATSVAIKAEFNRIARKYEEFGSSVSASFKLYSQAWSLAIGIALAICANIDGLRIFEAYRADPSLTAIVIEKMEKQDTLTNVDSTTPSAQQQLADLITLGVPIGWQFYPGCPFGADAEAWARSCPKCKVIPVEKREIGKEKQWLGERIVKTLWYDPGGFLLWLMVVVGTGVLIGLGAPFWFDVAKRLAQIRKGIQSASASAEYRLSGSDANGNYEKRKEIVNNVLSDAALEAAAQRSG